MINEKLYVKYTRQTLLTAKLRVLPSCCGSSVKESHRCRAPTRPRSPSTLVPGTF